MGRCPLLQAVMQNNFSVWKLITLTENIQGNACCVSQLCVTLLKIPERSCGLRREVYFGSQFGGQSGRSIGLACSYLEM